MDMDAFMAMAVKAGASYVTPRHDTYPFITPTNFNLSGKHVLITGASRGLGRAAAVAYGQGGASAIAVAARGSLDAVEKEVLEAAAKAGRDVPRILKINLDVGDLQSVEKAAATVFEQFGRLDILINNAAIIERFLPVQEGDPQDWAKVIDIDIKGPYYVTRAFLPLLLKKGDKTIINISSLAAFLTMPGASAYIQAKLALIKFSEVLQAEYQDQGILVYAVHPGAVITDMSMSAPHEMRAAMVDTPEIFAHTMVFLTSEKREWLGGRYLAATWDMEELLAKKDEIVQGDKLKVKLDL